MNPWTVIISALIIDSANVAHVGSMIMSTIRNAMTNETRTILIILAA
jgi:hypothetical protein